jgi:hypothetical protein
MFFERLYLKGKGYISFLLEGGRAAEAFQSTLTGRFWDGYGEDGCGGDPKFALSVV